MNSRNDVTWCSGAADSGRNWVDLVTDGTVLATFTLYLDEGIEVAHRYNVPPGGPQSRELLEGVAKMLLRALSGKPALVYLEHPIGVYRSDRILGYTVRVSGEGPGERVASELEEQLSFLRV